MGLCVEDTIVALATSPGAGARAVVRLSGPQALAIALSRFDPVPALPAGRRGWTQGGVRLAGTAAPLPAELYFWPGPATYTGQDLVELHTLSCPPLLDLLVPQLLQAGARGAQPGEFTMRAFLAGKLDLTQAEAVQAVITARDEGDLRQALTQLAGGVAAPLQQLREDLLDLLADVEAGLDFADEDIGFVSMEETLTRLAAGMARLTLLQRQLQQRATSGRPFRVVLAGQPNVGKSSLFNALAGASALVSPVPGTTRDYLSAVVVADGVPVELIDTPGFQEDADLLQIQAQALGRRQLATADLVLWCIDANAAPEPASWPEQVATEPSVLAVATKSDLAHAPCGLLATSARTGAGLDELQALLAQQARRQQTPPLVSSLSRCRHHVDSCLEHLRRAHGIVLFEDPAELLALELREGLDQLGQLVGAVYTDDLLDRIFSRFCIGK
jgi:tRNA modification GTPase